MSDESLRDVLAEEKETSLLDSFREAFLLLLGGVIGGGALNIVTSDAPLWTEVVLLVILLGVGVFTIYLINFADDLGRAIDRYR